jgi:hypothetical protein
LQQLNTDASNAALRDGLKWQPDEEVFGRRDSAVAAMTISYAVNSRQSGFDDVWREYTRRNEGSVSDEELRIWRAALFVCDAPRTVSALTEAERTVLEPTGRFDNHPAFEVAIAEIVKSSGSPESVGEESVRKLLGAIDPELNLALVAHQR